MRSTRTDLRILADDLTGALDSAAPFAHPGRSRAVVWGRPNGEIAGSATAIDTASREGSEADAIIRHRDLGEWLLGAGIAFKKIDSLLRGHVAAELAALAEAAPQCRFVIAPAFPYQGRFTRHGRQWRIGETVPVGPDLAADLAGRGLPASRGTHLRDAVSDSDLDAIVRHEMALPGSVIWVGSAGLAAALARHCAAGSHIASQPEGQMLALVGSDHAVTREQVERARVAHIAIARDGAGCDLARASLSGGHSCLVTVAVKDDRQAAGAAIATAFGRLLADCPRPGFLLATGGETLRAAAEALGAQGLAVEGALEPGLPVSRLVGGRWDGLAVVSKSGAFGRPDTLDTIAARAK